MPVLDFSKFLDILAPLTKRLPRLKIFFVGQHFKALFKMSNTHLELLDPIL